MKYDFTSIIERKNMDALAVDGVGLRDHAPTLPIKGFDFIPMWVADMNFATAPCITKALQDRIQHPLYGYFIPSTNYYDAIIQWQKEQNHVYELSKEDIGYENGVLGGVVSATEAFSTQGDSVLIHSPTYVGFTKSLTNIGRQIIHSPLYQDSKGVWRMDYQDMDEKIKKHHIHIAILCSPHNPCGRVWEKEELRKAMEVFKNNDCIVISDEIWSDIILEQNQHIPTQSVNEDARNRTIALYAPSKTFNLAGLIGSYHIVYNAYLRDRLMSQASKSHYNSMNVLSMHALIGAYSQEGKAWLMELNEVIGKNVSFACSFMKEQIPAVSCFKPEGTYMLFVDCESYCAEKHKTMDEILQKGWDVGIGWQDGRAFYGNFHIRMNLALPNECVVKAFQRMKEYVFI